MKSIPTLAAALALIAGSALAEMSEAEIAGALKAAGLAAPADAAMLRGDVTCDGAAYVVLGWFEADVPDDPLYWVVYVTRAAGAPAGAFAIGLPVGDGSDLALCRLDGAPDVTLRREMAELKRVVAETGQPSVCAIAVAVDDGMCDATRLHWLGEAVDGARLTYRRN